MITDEPTTADDSLAALAPIAALPRSSILPGWEDIGQLYDRHAAWFGLDSGPLKNYVLEGLAQREGGSDKLKTVMHSIRLHPSNVGMQKELALLLERAGRTEDALHVRRAIARLDPTSVDNQIAIGRIYERAGTYDIKDYYTRLFFRSGANFLLAVARFMATTGKTNLNELTLSDIKNRVNGSLNRWPGNVALHLAKGFVDVAEGNFSLARMSFLRASFLAELPEPPGHNAMQNSPGVDGGGEEADSWSLQYARAFLINPTPPNLSSVIAFPSVDASQLALVRGALFLSQGSIFPALDQYWKAVSRALSGRGMRTHKTYNGFRIVVHDKRFYAVPTSVRNFSFYRGIVVRIPGSIEDNKVHVGDTLSPRWQAIIRPIWRFGRRTVAPRLARIRVVRLIGRRLSTVAIAIYVKFWGVRDAFADADVISLRQRIDQMRHPKSEGGAGAASAPKKAA